MISLHRLPVRTASAAENMAADFLLLKRYPAGQIAARFRHYNWRGSCFTFGYSQKISYIREQLPVTAERLDICRRPTGGGLVDHRDDWTYALVIPRGHALYDARATESYRIVHAAIADTLNALGHRLILKPRPAATDEQAAAAAPTICFERPEIFDVINPANGEKVAGAAQKRSKEGLLFQGSIWKPTVPETDWDAFEENFLARLATALAAEIADTPWPDNDDELLALSEQYAAPEWNEAR